MNKCDKCNSKADGAAITEGDKTYHFCNVCFTLLDKIPTGFRCEIFLKPDASQDECLSFTHVERNMLAAKERRIKGKSLWNQKNS